MNNTITKRMNFNLKKNFNQSTFLYFTRSFDFRKKWYSFNKILKLWQKIRNEANEDIRGNYQTPFLRVHLMKAGSNDTHSKTYRKKVMDLGSFFYTSRWNLYDFLLTWIPCICRFDSREFSHCVFLRDYILKLFFDAFLYITTQILTIIIFIFHFIFVY